MLLLLCLLLMLHLLAAGTSHNEDNEQKGSRRLAKTTKLSSKQIFEDFFFLQQQQRDAIVANESLAITADNAAQQGIISGAVSSTPISKEKLDVYVNLLTSSSSATLAATNITTQLTLMDVEYLMALKEYERSTGLYSSMISSGEYEVYGVYHVSSRKQFWKEVIQEQLFLLDGRRKFPNNKLVDENVLEYAGYEWDMEHVFSSLLAMSSGLYINAAIENMNEFYEIRDFIRSLPLRNHDKIVIGYNVTVPRYIFGDQYVEQRAKIEREGNHSTGEYGSIMLLHGFCKRFQQEQDAVSFRAWSASSTATSEGKTESEAMPTYDDENKYLPEHYRIRLNRYGGADMFDSLASSSTNRKGKKKNKPKTKQQKTGKKAMVFYMHNKGACCRKAIRGPRDPVASWREMMNTFNVEFPSICMRAVGVKKYATCGTEYQAAHYSGNYWWSDCEHLAQLPPLAWPLSWGDPEFFIGWFSDDYSRRENQFYHCAYSTYHTLGELYIREYPRQDYLSRLWLTVMQSKLPTSWGALPENMTMKDNHLKYCKAIRNPMLYKALLDAMPTGEDLLQKYQFVNVQGVQERLIRRGYFGMREVIDYYTDQKNKIPASLLKSTSSSSSAAASVSQSSSNS